MINHITSKLLYTEMSSDLLIQSKLTHQQNKRINKLIKTPRAYVSVKKKDSLNEYSGYDIKQSDGKAPVLLEYRFIAIAPRFTLARCGIT